MIVRHAFTEGHAYRVVVERWLAGLSYTVLPLPERPQGRDKAIRAASFALKLAGARIALVLDINGGTAEQPPREGRA
jgi:hypothetical protein